MGNRAKYPISCWWGWGKIEKRYSLHNRPHFIPYLKNRLNIESFRVAEPPDLDHLTLRKSNISLSVLEKIRSAVGKDSLSTDKDDRIRHSVGRSYRDLLALRLGALTNVPDAVVFPETEKSICDLMHAAREEKLCLVPIGGATSVVGGMEPVMKNGFAGIIAVNLTRMSRILEIDSNSLFARVESGIYGEEIEKQLNSRGLSMGHFPESFHYSTLGGWIAASSSGQNSTLYGRISDMVLGLRMVTPALILDTGSLPAHAQGPDLKNIAIGSEGTLGIITEARIKLHPMPHHSLYCALMFPTFKAAHDAARRMLRNGIVPAVLRVSDGPETEMAEALMHEPRLTAVRLIQSKLFGYLARKGYRPGERSLMILGFEGSKPIVRAQKREALRHARMHGSFYLGKNVGKMWKKHRFEQPYLRDTLMNMGLLIDTLENRYPMVGQPESSCRSS